MWVFLSVTGRAGTALTLNGTQWLWIVVTAVFLLGYVWIWYSALKWAPATLVTSILTIGAIVTILLSASFQRQTATAPQLVAMALLVLGVIIYALPLRLRRQRVVEAV